MTTFSNMKNDDNCVKMNADKEVAGISIGDWCRRQPPLVDVMAGRETIWFNSNLEKAATFPAMAQFGKVEITEAAARLDRFRPYVARVFPETTEAGGLIESPLQSVPNMQAALAEMAGCPLPGKLLLKCDNLLPISGSVKARGGIYEVLKYAETVAKHHGLLQDGDSYALLAEPQAKKIFTGYRIAVGSTGNLGLSIGIMGARLGFAVTVHMSAEARAWKKALLREKGVTVVEHQGDYGAAVAEGRRQAADDPKCHFIDDENSTDLFFGYAVAAERLQKQLRELNIAIDGEHPLFVYLPCGVGGAPGGITFGLKHIFGKHVHAFFAEPVQSPCMLLGLCTGLHHHVSVRDFGLSNLTTADGLAVGRPSAFIGKTIQGLVDGGFTVSDDSMLRLLAILADKESILMEPSALAGFAGPTRIAKAKSYLQRHGLITSMPQATHIVWGTGGSMVPAEEMKDYYQLGKRLLIKS